MEKEFSNFSFIKDIIIGVSALVGMILGLYNLVHSRRREKVKLEIIPKSVMRETRNVWTGEKGLLLADNDFSTETSLFAFEIINKSNFSVTISEIGFKLKGKRGRLAIPHPMLGDNGAWPRKLEPRDSVIVCGSLSNILDKAKKNKIDKAYVRSNCDDIGYGESEALRKLLDYAKKT